MMRCLFYTLWAISLGTLLMSMGGCATTQPSKFYVLSPLEASLPKSPTAGVNTGLGIGIGPINLPPYLNRPQIVIRATRNELHLSDFNKWAIKKNNLNWQKERELVDRAQYSTRAEAKADMFQYMEVFDIRQQRHSSIGHRRPEQFEATESNHVS